MRLTLLSIPCLLACIGVYAQSPERLDSFRGHFSIGETVYVSIGSTGSKMEWVQVGTMNRGHHIISLDTASSTLTLKDQSGEIYTLPLTRLASDHQLDPEKKEDPTQVAPKAGPAVRLPTVAPPPGRKPTVVLEVYPPKDRAALQSAIDWEWIESDDNPMRQRPVRMSVADWRKCQTEAEKADMIEFYRQHGWEVTVQVTNKSLDFNYRKLKPPK